MTIKYIHYRFFDPEIATDSDGEYFIRDVIRQKGGYSVAYTYEPNLKMGWYGWAKCSKNDFFCRKTGRLIAEERLKHDKQLAEIQADTFQDFMDKLYDEVIQL